MNIRLIRFETYGIKNICNKLSIDFSNGKIEPNSPFYRAKAIFGLNGSGKTAILDSIEIYKSFLLDDKYLTNSNTNKLVNMLNRKLNTFFFKMYFIGDLGDKLKAYSHEIAIKDDNGNLYISSEALKEIKGETIFSTNISLIYSVDNGVLKADLGDLAYSEAKLSKSTLISLAARRGNEAISSSPILGVIELAEKILVYKDFLDSTLNSSLADLISEDGLDAYIAETKKLESFIKTFNNDLEEIALTKAREGDKLLCTRVLKYKDYSIPLNEESRGIRKLAKMHFFINEAVKGNFVFIDELDSSLNAICLNRLLEFFLEYGMGILCFTTNSLEPISVLKKEANSLLFLGETGKLVVWNMPANINPAKHYREGYILDSPYNLDYLDFYSAFDVE